MIEVTPSYTVLMAPVEAVGHFSACIGIGQQLLKRGHRVVFATPNTWRGKLEPLGFEEEYYQDEVDEEPSEKWGDIVAAMAPALAMPPMQKMEFLHTAFYVELVRKTKDSHDNMLCIMQDVMPDVVVVDNVMQLPALMDNKKVPWIFCTSLNPLCGMVSDDLPPAFAGYSVFDPDKAVWKEHHAKMKEVFKDTFEEFRSWVLEKGGPKLELNSQLWQVHSPYANICMYPTEMSYTMHSPFPPKWHCFDAFVRKEDVEFEIPAELANLPGKLVYFSLGSIGCSEVNLMRRLIGMLAKSPHRFIVSKGPLGDQLVLPSNMWGANSLPQTLILPKVDLVITHGGNNTVTESFYFGKPLLVLPLFADQMDNATRVQETGHGVRLQPYEVTEAELLQTVDSLLGNEILKRRMRAIGHRIQNSDCQARAADVVISVADEAAKPKSGRRSSVAVAKLYEERPRSPSLLPSPRRPSMGF